jgi:hypothetical protein
MLTDDVLLEIFDFYRKNHKKTAYIPSFVWEWHLLVHVCRRWRQVIFESPNRLNLQILCTPARKNLGIWPAFPIIIEGSWCSFMPNSEDNLIAALALEHLDRVRSVTLHLTGSQLRKMVTVMQKPFPLLTRLNILLEGRNTPVLPAEFLGGSAPCLQKIALTSAPYPALPTLLLSASDLVTLELRKIPAAGYISPEAMVAALAALPKLKTLIIEFQSAFSLPDRIHPPHITRTVLPALIHFAFRGTCEYLEDLVAQIDSPQLNRIHIHYLNQLVDAAQLSKFVDRSVGPKLSPRHLRITLFRGFVSFAIYRPADRSSNPHPAISCEGFNWHVSDIAQVFSKFSATLSNVVHLKLNSEDEEYPENADEAERLEVEWLHLLHQFSTVRTLDVSQEFAVDVAYDLEDITGEMVTEVLPSLDLIYLAGHSASSVEMFVAARRQSDRPVTVVNTKKEFKKKKKEILKSYISK